MKVSTVTGFMFLGVLTLVAALNLEAEAAQTPSEINVTVNNTPANPVPTKEVSSPAKQPFQTDASSSSGFFDVTTVPAGKRLVIETVTIRARIEISGSGLAPQIHTRINGIPTTHLIVANLIDQDARLKHFGATHAVRLYADPSTTVRIDCNAFVSANQLCTFTISGYFVDVP